MKIRDTHLEILSMAFDAYVKKRRIYGRDIDGNVTSFPSLKDALICNSVKQIATFNYCKILVLIDRDVYWDEFSSYEDSHCITAVSFLINQYLKG